MEITHAMGDVAVVDVDSIVGSYAVRISDPVFHEELAARKLHFGPPTRSRSDWTFVNATNAVFGIASKLKSDPDRVNTMLEVLKEDAMRDPASPLAVSSKGGQHATVYIWGCDPEAVESTRTWIDRVLHVFDSPVERSEESRAAIDQTDSYVVRGRRLFVSIPLGRYCVDNPSAELLVQLHARRIPFAVRGTTAFVRPLVEDVPFVGAGSALAPVWLEVCDYLQSEQSRYTRMSIVWDGYRECFNVATNSQYAMRNAVEWLHERVTSVSGVYGSTYGKRHRSDGPSSHWLARSVR